MANYDLTYEGSVVQRILDTGKSLEDNGYIFVGAATTSTAPGTPTERVAYIGGPGTYNNFGSTTVVPSGSVGVFKYNGSAWVNDVIAVTSGGCVYAGIATPTTNPGTPTSNVFYVAVTAGTYTNFGGLAVTQGINILKYNGSAWSVEQVVGIDDEPTAGSEHLVKSGGVSTSIISNWITHKTKINGNRELVADENFYTTPLIPFGGGSFILNASGITSSDNLRIVVYAADGVTILNGWVIEPNVSRNNLSADYRYIRFTGKYNNSAELTLNGKIAWNKTVALTASVLDEFKANIKTYIDDYKKLGYVYGGNVTPSSSPINSQEKIFYSAATKGAYSNFSNIEVKSNEFCLIRPVYSQGVLSSWAKECSIAFLPQTGYLFKGIASAATIPTTPDNDAYKELYLSISLNTYTNFLDANGNPIVNNGYEIFFITPVFAYGVFSYWNKEVLPIVNYPSLSHAITAKTLINGILDRNGKIVDYADYYVTDYIPFTGGEFTWNTSEINDSVYMLAYDSSYNIINRWKADVSSVTRNITSGDYAYVRVAFKFNNVGNLIVNGTSVFINNFTPNDLSHAITDYSVQKSLDAISKEGYLYAGMITPVSSPLTTEIEVFYIAATSGTYTNFGNISIAQGESAIVKLVNGQWSKETISNSIDPSDIEDAVSNWLDEHPEATTTVEDDSITVSKLAVPLKSLQYFKAEEGGGANTAIGEDCGAMTGLANRSNIGIGNRTLLRNTSGIKNITVGNDNMCSDDSPENTLTGERNTSIGYHALYRESAGNDNAAMGAESLDDNTSGSQNTGCGAYSLQRNSKGNNNTAVGFRALCGGDTSVVYDANKSYGYNVAVGAYALEKNTSGNGNTAIGVNAMQDKNYSECVAIGRYAGAGIDGNGQLMIANSDTTKETAMVYGEFNKTNLAQQKMRINAGVFMLPNLPVSDPQIAGALWNDNGVLKISSGS